MNSTEAWYQANLECKHACDQMQASIATLKAEQATLKENYAKRLASYDSTALQLMAKQRGKAGKDIARCRKQVIIDWLVQVKIDELDLRIAELQKKIREQSPSPYWREVI